jgi:hypothetical protein
VDQGYQPYVYRHVGAILNFLGANENFRIFTTLLMVKHMVIFAV